MPATKDLVEQALQLIIDPEVDLDIWTLGLVRNIDIKDDSTIHFVITYTSQMCPAGPAIQEAIRTEMLNLGFENVSIEVTFDPPWEMPEVVKTMFGL